MTRYVDPDRETFHAFEAMDRPGPIQMINLVKFRARAAYPDGRVATGAEAYAAYARDSAPILARVGGHVHWSGRFEMTLIGPQDEAWDACFIAHYPSVTAFAEMVRDPAYRLAVLHRQAAVETSRLIRCAPAEAGATFG